jgi:hypothetical protein
MSRRFPGRLWLIVAYGLFTCSGVLALIGPSPVLLKQGGHTIAVAWAVCCFACAVAGLYGTLRRRVVVELGGLTLGASASLTWAAALIMQAVDTHSVSSLTAASLALTSVTLVGQRWVEAADAVRAGRRE